jgi:hypothetical protein
VSDDVEMTRDQLIAALCALGEKLTARGVHAQMFIVGGLPWRWSTPVAG